MKHIKITIIILSSAFSCFMMSSCFGRSEAREAQDAANLFLKALKTGDRSVLITFLPELDGVSGADWSLFEESAASGRIERITVNRLEVLEKGRFYRADAGGLVLDLEKLPGGEGEASWRIRPQIVRRKHFDIIPAE